jgi:hypothetical protein
VHYNGNKWKRVPAPNIGQLNGVAALSPTDAWAIAPNDDSHRVLHWNGTAWQSVRLPRIENLQPQSISGSGPHNVWIVGWRAGAKLGGNSLGDHTLALHLTEGQHWKSVSSPNPARKYDEFNSVATDSVGDAWAVGNASGRCFSAHWNGAGWRRVPLPASQRHRCRSLVGLGYGGPSDLWAVGSSFGSGFGDAYYLHWTGHGWRRVPGPTGTETPTPSAVSGSDGRDMWSVGCAQCSGSMIGHRPAHRWRNVRFSLNGIPHHAAQLVGVDTLSPTNAWAVGYTFGSTGSGATRALVMHWNGQSWKPRKIAHVPSAGFGNAT